MTYIAFAGWLRMFGVQQFGSSADVLRLGNTILSRGSSYDTPDGCSGTRARVRSARPAATTALR